MKKAVFLALVLASVNELIKNSTPEEKARVNFEDLQKAAKGGCILAQMTGKYNTQRAKDLVKKDLFVHAPILDGLITGSRWCPTGYLPTVIDKIIPAHDASGNFVSDVKSEYVLSAFEIFIMIKGANVEELVGYLKGEREAFEPSIVEVSVAV